MKEQEPITRVIFRKFKQGNVIAMFPAEAGSVNQPWTCSSYQHTGQHGAAHVQLVYHTKLAKPSEYRDLAQELRRIGYRLKIVKRFTRKDYEERVRQLK